MTQHHDDAIDALTDRQCADEMEAVNNRLRKRIADLQQRLEIAVDANQALRIENARLRVLP